MEIDYNGVRLTCRRVPGLGEVVFHTRHVPGAFGKNGKPVAEVIEVRIAMPLWCRGE